MSTTPPNQSPPGSPAGDGNGTGKIVVLPTGASQPTPSATQATSVPPSLAVQASELQNPTFITIPRHFQFLVGYVVAALALATFVLFAYTIVAGKSAEHIIATLFAFLVAACGQYMFIRSFEFRASTTDVGFRSPPDKDGK